MTRTWLRRDGEPRIEFGADYNPEQWPREVWHEDVRLMQEAGVTMVSLAIFSWATIQPRRGEWHWEWLDEIMDLLAEHGIGVDLATSTASPPAWLTLEHPEILPVDENGLVLHHGGRQQWRATSAVYRQHALELVERIAGRYATHPALIGWHVSNELGCHNLYDYSDDAAREFRRWLQDRYGSLDGLNEAWATAFWAQRVGAWEEVHTPRRAASILNPTQVLDFKRFSSAMLREHLIAESDVLRRITPEIPITTNFMVMGGTNGMDVVDWSKHVDFVSNDHYVHPGPQALDELSFSANFVGHLTDRPWLLLETAPSAVNWQPVNRAKQPGELARDSLTHVAHGADGICYFQWRQSKGGAEKYHSALVPHAGHDSQLFRDVSALGRTIGELAHVATSTPLQSQVAILLDYESWWASEAGSHPTTLLRYRQEALDWYAALTDLGIRADVVHADADLAGYRMVVAPILHIVGDARRAALEAYVAQGGHLVATYGAGIVDERDHVHLGGYPGALRELLGIRIEEAAPLMADESVELGDGTVGTIWTDRIELRGAESLVQYLSGPTAGQPAVTWRQVGEGGAGYVSTRLGQEGLRTTLPQLLERSGVESELPEALRGKVLLAARATAEREHWFLVNRSDEPLTLASTAGEQLADLLVERSELPGNGVLVLTRALETVAR